MEKEVLLGGVDEAIATAVPGYVTGYDGLQASSEPDMDMYVTYGCAVRSDSKIYYTGGRETPQEATSMDVETGTWSPLPNWFGTYGFEEHACAVLADKLYMIGGR